MSTTAQNLPPQPTPEEATITQKLAKDRPTIDAALKSFVVLVSARSYTASTTDSLDPTNSANLMMGLIPAANMNTANSKNLSGSALPGLQLVRVISQCVNAYTFPIHCTVASALAEKPGTSDEKKALLLELSITSQLWNGLIQSKKKPSTFLGRIALKHAWQHNLKEEIDSRLKEKQANAEESVIQQEKSWLEEFERLLFHIQDPSSSQDDDSALLWHADGGKMEMHKRRERRQSAAAERRPVAPS